MSKAAKITAICNQKGGVGKTVTAFNLGIGLVILKFGITSLVRTLDDDEATIIMVDSNLQREKILPSEKAFVYKMKLEALKHQGKRRDLTSEPAVPKLTAREKIAQDAGENCGLTVTRYIALTRLIPPPLALVDEDKLAVSTAADYISDLAKQEQTDLVSVMDKLNVSIMLRQNITIL